MGPDRSFVSLPEEELRARTLLMELAPPTPPGARWDAIWPNILSQCVIRLVELKKIANEYRNAGVMAFPGWQRPGERTPKDDYLVHRGTQVHAQGTLL
jgi:hypothetical protein